MASFLLRQSEPRKGPCQGFELERLWNQHDMKRPTHVVVWPLESSFPNLHAIQERTWKTFLNATNACFCNWYFLVITSHEKKHASQLGIWFIFPICGRGRQLLTVETVWSCTRKSHSNFLLDESTVISCNWVQILGSHNRILADLECRMDILCLYFHKIFEHMRHTGNEQQTIFLRERRKGIWKSVETIWEWLTAFG